VSRTHITKCILTLTSFKRLTPDTIGFFPPLYHLLSSCSMDKVDGTILESYCSQADAARKLGFRPSQMTQALLEGKEHAEPIPGGGYLTYRDGVPLGGWKSEAGRRLVLVDDQTVQKKKANVVSRKCGGGRRPEKRAKIVHKAVDSIQRPRKKKVPSHCYFDASRATFGPITRAKEALEEEVNEYTGDDALHNFLSGLDLHAISPSHLRERQAFFEVCVYTIV